MSRLSAHVLALADPVMERVYGARKRRLFRGHPTLIVEVGPGSGNNFRYYRPGTRIIAFEPNEAQHERLRQRAAIAGLELDLRGGKAETLDLDDASVPMVVSTLVLCSVDDHVRVIDEIHRVLQPGGRFLFIEHVAAPAGSKLRRWQSRLRGPWHFLFDGCTLDRDSAEVVMGAGFQERELERFRLRRKWLPFSTHVIGVVEKPS